LRPSAAGWAVDAAVIEWWAAAPWPRGPGPESGRATAVLLLPLLARLVVPRAAGGAPMNGRPLRLRSEALFSEAGGSADVVVSEPGLAVSPADTPDWNPGRLLANSEAGGLLEVVPCAPGRPFRFASLGGKAPFFVLPGQIPVAGGRSRPCSALGAACSTRGAPVGNAAAAESGCALAAPNQAHSAGRRPRWRAPRLLWGQKRLSFRRTVGGQQAPPRIRFAAGADLLLEEIPCGNKAPWRRARGSSGPAMLRLPCSELC